MLTYQEINKIKDVISDGLGIRPDINFAYYLNAIDDSSDRIKRIESKMSQIINNQRILDDKLNMIINMLQSK